MRLKSPVFACLAFATLFTLVPGAPAARGDDLTASPFVRLSGGQFVLGDEPFYFTGSNFYRLALGDAFGGQAVKEWRGGRAAYPQIEAVMANYRQAGVRVVRLWAFSCAGAHGTGNGAPIVNADRQINADGIERLDFAVAAASRNDVKLILPLVNYESEYCGMDWWVDHALGGRLESLAPPETASLKWSCMNPATGMPERVVTAPGACGGLEARLSKELFYSEPAVRQAFKEYVRTFLTRVNPYTGRAYKDEPAVMAIEVANEPHTSDHYECMAANPGLGTDQCLRDAKAAYHTGDLVNAWLGDISAYVKSIDTNHLVSSGEEGYRTGHDDPSCLDRHVWIHDGLKGVDFARDAALPTLDFMTTHLYPDNWNVPVSDLDWFKRCVVADRAHLARQNHKPVVMEESGFSDQGYPGKPDDYRRDRGYYISRMFHDTTAAGFQGTMVWQAAPWTTDGQAADADSFTFPIKVRQGGRDSYTLEGLAVINQAQCMAKLAATPAGPDAAMSQCLYLCPQGTSVDATGLGWQADGSRCVRPADAASGAHDVPPSPDFPRCPAGTPVVNDWGWLTDAKACAATPSAQQQYQTSGGCSCKARP